MFKTTSFNSKNFIPIAIAILFHVTGLLGILFTPYKDWFVNSTPLVLITMFLLLSSIQLKIAKAYILFFTVSFIVGMATEIVGVQTGILFGHYQYGQVLGPKIFGVPLLIGLNWFLIVYCSGSLVTQYISLLQKKWNLNMNTVLYTILVIVGGALLATFFDIILEPVAIKLQFWSWENGQVPLFNYTCWFLISGALLGFKMYVLKKETNPFATSLYIIQTAFFLILHLLLSSK